MKDSAPHPKAAVNAAEYVLRLLDPEQERAVERRMQTDARLRREVVLWAIWLGGLAHDMPPSSAQPAARRALCRRLFDDR
ncbi:hypothetical protein ROJ8625_03495 [Roseivivax jejudonensis]|uniref:Uncharacterized protein n=1 Tax=Roseivivax jejudonensis TaxID=1529041 RepID=A0A1X7A3S3_9RHOB|nr:hypothetical protein [Roseivivax jejudonensis]SLN67888.1 hypothetical protein ROJ8625_03495 [Roseivivax jejudonensis]